MSEREEIIKMAKAAGIAQYGLGFTCWEGQLERFFHMAQAAEREECAKVCEDGVANAADWDSCYWDQACENRAAAIRAKGKHEQ